MKVKELIQLLLKVDQEKEVVYSSYSEGIWMGISGVSDNAKSYAGWSKEKRVTIDE